MGRGRELSVVSCQLSAVSKVSTSRCGSGSRRQNLWFLGRLGGIWSRFDLPAGYEPDGRRPCGKQVSSRNQFRRSRGQESPVPSEQTNHREPYNQIEQRIRRRYRAFNKHWEGADLQDVGGNGYSPGQAVLWFLYRVEMGFELIFELVQN